MGLRESGSPLNPYVTTEVLSVSEPDVLEHEKEEKITREIFIEEEALSEEVKTEKIPVPFLDEEAEKPPEEELPPEEEEILTDLPVVVESIVPSTESVNLSDEEVFELDIKEDAISAIPEIEEVPSKEEEVSVEIIRTVDDYARASTEEIQTGFQHKNQEKICIEQSVISGVYDISVLVKEYDYIIEETYRKKIKVEPVLEKAITLPVLKEEVKKEVKPEVEKIPPMEITEPPEEEGEDYKTLLEDILLAAIDKKAYNIHFIVNFPPLIRLHKNLQKLDFPGITSDFTQYFIDNMLDENQLHSFLYNKNLDMVYQFSRDGKPYRFKVNLYEHLLGINANFWLLSPRMLDLKKLNLPDFLPSLIYYKSGLVIIGGPAKSGKTTTLNALLNLINETRSLHIISIEHIIEYVHLHKKSLIKQRQIGLHSETFKSALNFAIRDNPDVIVVGELTDADIMYWSLLAAEAGKLVLTTLPATDSINVINSIIDIFPGERQNEIKFILARSLKAIVSQRLLRSLNKDCLVPAVEILSGCDRLTEIIKEGNLFEINELINNDSYPGMCSLDTSLLNLYKTGKISLETALEFAVDITRFKTNMSEFERG